MFAMDSLSEYVRSSVSLSDTIPNVLHLSLFKKLQNRFWLFVIVLMDQLQSFFLLVQKTYVCIFCCPPYFLCSCFDKAPFLVLKTLLIFLVIHASLSLVDESFDGTVSSKIFINFFSIDRFKLVIYIFVFVVIA